MPVPSTSCAVASFLRSQVLVVAAAANGSVFQSPPEACALTSENVTSSALASLKGESLIMTFSVEPDEGDVVDPLHAIERTVRAASNAREPVRMVLPLRNYSYSGKRDAHCGSVS